MTQYTAFYACYSKDLTVDLEAGVKLPEADIAARFSELMLAPDDYFGLVDDDGTTLQMMRNRVDRVWIEIPCPEKQGSYGAHWNLTSVTALLQNLPSRFETLKNDLVFQSWDGDNDEKLYAVTAEQIQHLADGHGVGFATDLVTCQDMGVGYMYREEPDFDDDSGWRFLSGEEDQGYMDDAGNSGIYDINLIANYDPDIIPFLNAAVGSAFARDEDDRFIPVE